MFFLFQAEDGIRYLVRSRGLGDVYKRQPEHLEEHMRPFRDVSHTMGKYYVTGNHEYYWNANAWTHHMQGLGYQPPVSYTHLTLPTSDLV